MDFRSKPLSFAAKPVLLFNNLHQTIIVLLGYYIVDWRTGVLFEYVVLSNVSVAMALLPYEQCVRRVGVSGMLVRNTAGVQ